MFREAEKGIKPGTGRMSVSLDTLTRYVRDTVEEMDLKASERLALSPPADKRQLADMVVQLGILTAPSYPCTL